MQPHSSTSSGRGTRGTTPRTRRRLLALATAAAVPAAFVIAPTAQAATPSAAVARVTPAKATKVDKTSAREAKRVDSVPTPRLGWYKCYGGAECATVSLPLDYDQPKGAKVTVAVLRVKARNQRNKIGSLFVNPGGPGGSGVQIALAASQFLGEGVLDRFDVVGFDPRGTNFSDNLRCFKNIGDQSTALTGFERPFPYTSAEERAWIASSKTLGRACSTTGKPLSASMSTAEVARDMDVLRRAVGDKRLTYLGFSYGSYLGQVYANLFPDRVRALALDGVLDPIAWAGTPKTAARPQTDRLRSADGSWRALREILVRCDKVGGTKCTFAPGDPVKNLAVIANRLKAKPLEIDGPGGPFTFTYADMVNVLLGALYSPTGHQEVVSFLTQLWILTEPPATATSAARSRATAQLVKITKAIERRQRHGWDFPYENGFEAFLGVLCTDGLNPRRAEDFTAPSRAADRRAPYFGRLWSWTSSPCAMSTWTARDEDAYYGPFTRRTAAPVLVVGNYWDPATPYEGAVKAASLLPNSRLLTSDSWGHTAYGTSDCVTKAIDAYLLKVTLPAAKLVCVGDSQPFQDEMLRGRQPAAPTQKLLPRTGTKQLPPVVPVAPQRF
jgi:pimeloyl-ACP methyl ester carboxylesterase